MWIQELIGLMAGRWGSFHFQDIKGNIVYKRDMMKRGSIINLTCPETERNLPELSGHITALVKMFSLPSTSPAHSFCASRLIQL